MPNQEAELPHTEHSSPRYPKGAVTWATQLSSSVSCRSGIGPGQIVSYPRLTSRRQSQDCTMLVLIVSKLGSVFTGPENHKRSPLRSACELRLSLLNLSMRKSQDLIQYLVSDYDWHFQQLPRFVRSSPNPKLRTLCVCVVCLFTYACVGQTHTHVYVSAKG